MKARGSTAFTLVEILIVVVILAILAAVVIPQYAGATNDAYRAIAGTFHKTLNSATVLYLMAWNRYPQSFDTFVAYTDWGEESNQVKIHYAMRQKLASPDARLGLNGGKLIRLEFKNGLVAEYSYVGPGKVTAEYTDP